MSGADSYLLAEKMRLERLIEHLQEEIASRPPGSIVMKIKSGNPYAYVVYRKNGKVITDYVGKPMERSVTRLAAKIAERRKYRKELLRLKPELDRIVRMIKVGSTHQNVNRVTAGINAESAANPV